MFGAFFSHRLAELLGKLLVTAHYKHFEETWCERQNYICTQICNHCIYQKLVVHPLQIFNANMVAVSTQLELHLRLYYIS